jgi:hypothetical protein
MGIITEEGKANLLNYKYHPSENSIIGAGLKPLMNYLIRFIPRVCYIINGFINV